MARTKGGKSASDSRRLKKLADRCGKVAAACVIDVLVNDRMGLRKDSASFIASLEKMWALRGVAPEDVWSELDDRLKLGENMRATGKRVRKSGRVRSTKLP